MKKSASLGVIPAAVIILAAFLPLFNAEACTRMFWNTNGQAMLVARNMDLDMDDQPIIYIFPKGIKKNGGVDINPATWTSQYGSVVVTNLGSSTFSSEGMNTAGLGFHSLYLTTAQFENRDSRPGVLQWRYGEYLLDNAATVAEAIALLYQTQLVPEVAHGRSWPQHYAIEDASGDSAVIEFVGGQMHVYMGAEYNVLTNDPTLDQHLLNVWRYKYFGGTLPLPGDIDPMSRFVRASAFLSTLNASFSEASVKPTLIASLFVAIRSIMEPFGATWFLGDTPIPSWPTLWTSVSDLTNKRFYFSHNVARNDFWIDMKKLNFSKRAGIRYLKADRPGLTGEVSRLFKRP